MRERWAQIVLVVGSVVAAVALYLPWRQGSCGAGCTARGTDSVAGLLNLFAASQLRVDGWESGSSRFVALSALLLAGLAVTALVRPRLTGQLPLASASGLVAYFVVAGEIEVRSVARERALGAGVVPFHYTYGAYLALAAAVVVAAAGVWLRRRGLTGIRQPRQLAILAVLFALLVAYLLPWQRFTFPARLSLIGLSQPAAFVGVALAFLLGHALWRGASAAIERLSITAAIALFTVAAVASLPFPGSRAYGAWVALGAALALVVLSAPVGALRSPELVRPPWPVLAPGAGVALLVVGLFLPWQRACYSKSADFGPFSGKCISTSGFATVTGTVAALLALALLVVAFAPRRLPVSRLELAAGVALLTATLGFELQTGGGSAMRWHIGYGAVVAFVGAALLLAAVLSGVRSSVSWSSASSAALVPVVVVTAYLGVVALPWWDVLPQNVQSALRFAPLSWLTIAGVLVAIRLFRLWVGHAAGGVTGSEWLVILPMVLLALATLDLVRLRDRGIDWGGGAVVALSILLVAVGRQEERQGLGRLRVPEILRVDRL